MDKKYDFLQLPPIRKGEDANMVKMVWEFINLDDERQKVVLDELDFIKTNRAFSLEENMNHLRYISEEEIATYRESLREVIRDIIHDACKIAHAVLKEVFIKGGNIDELAAANPQASDYIYAMYYLFLNDDDFDDLIPDDLSENEGGPLTS